MLNKKQKDYLKNEYCYIGDTMTKFRDLGDNEKGHEYYLKMDYLYQIIDCLLECQGEDITKANWLWED